MWIWYFPAPIAYGNSVGYRIEILLVGRELHLELVNLTIAIIHGYFMDPVLREEILRTKHRRSVFLRPVLPWGAAFVQLYAGQT